MKKDIALLVVGAILGVLAGEMLALVASIHLLWLRIVFDSSLAVSLGVLAFFWSTNQDGKHGAIQVFLPKWDDSALKGDFYQDGRVQYEGFKQADIHDGANISSRLEVKYQPLYEYSTAKEILDLMEQLYKEGSTYFVMTMSGKAGLILDGFKQWHNQIVGTGRNREKRNKLAPVLIVTVASAPGLADAENGIVRWYIRSEEESRLLADHLKRNLGCVQAAAFGVENRAGMRDSPYGEQGIRLFRKEFERLGGKLPEDYEFYVTTDTAKTYVKTFLDKCKHSDFPGVFVVGYGDMVKNTLTELITGGYEGSIVCTSTLTDGQWQPSEAVLRTYNKVKIFTVLPRLNEGHLRDRDRNVVFLFARKTLLRILKLTAKTSDSKMFLANWGKEDKSEALVQEYLACGDIRVELEFVSIEKVK